MWWESNTVPENWDSESSVCLDGPQDHQYFILCVVCVFQTTCWPDFSPRGWVLQQTVTESWAVCKTHVRDADLLLAGYPDIPDTQLMLLGHICRFGPPLTLDVYMWWLCVSSLWSSACSTKVLQLILQLGARRGSGEPGVTSSRSFLDDPGRVASLAGWKRLRARYSRNVNSIAQLLDMRACPGSHIKSKAAHLLGQFLCQKGATPSFFSMKVLFYCCQWVAKSIILLLPGMYPADSPLLTLFLVQFSLQ